MSCGQVSVFSSAMFLGSFGSSGGGGAPKSVPRGSAPASGIPGLPPPPFPPRTLFLLECLIRKLQCGARGRLGASAWCPDPSGQAVWGENQASLEGSQKR